MDDGYKNLIVWRNTSEIRKRVYDLTAASPKIEVKRVSQMRDAARSVKQNVQEGYRRKNDKEFLRFLAFSRGSLAELKGDIEDSREDDLISEIEFESLNALICKTDFLFNRLMQALSKSIQSRSMHVPVGRLGPSVPIGPKPC